METTTATERQIGFARTLVRDRDWSDRANGNIFERCMDLSEAEQTRFIGKRECSEVIDFLLSCPKIPLDKQQDQPEIGVYVFPDGSIVKTQPNKAKTNVYTMVWVEIRGERLVDATEERVHGEWEYAPELKARIPEARKMTLDEAKAFILRYGKCVRCSRKLKAADSVERGIGPVCVQYFSF